MAANAPTAGTREYSAASNCSSNYYVLESRDAWRGALRRGPGDGARPGGLAGLRDRPPDDARLVREGRRPARAARRERSAPGADRPLAQGAARRAQRAARRDHSRRADHGRRRVHVRRGSPRQDQGLSGAVRVRRAGGARPPLGRRPRERVALLEQRGPAARRQRARERDPRARHRPAARLPGAGPRPELRRTARIHDPALPARRLCAAGGHRCPGDDRDRQAVLARMERRAQEVAPRRPPAPGVPAAAARRSRSGRPHRGREGVGPRGRYLDAAAAQADPEPPSSRRARGDRRQPRAVRARAQAGRIRRGAAPREWSGHRPGAGDAGVLGRVDRPRQRLGRQGDGRPARPRPRAARRGVVRDPPRLALTRGGAGLLLRFRERGPLAALPHRARAARVPDRRLAALQGGEREVRRRPLVGSGLRGPDRARAGLPLRASAAADPGAPAARDGDHVLAHPLAELGAPGHLPMADQPARGDAGSEHHRLPHAVPLQQLPRVGRPFPGGPHRPRAERGRPARAQHPRAALPDLARVARSLVECDAAGRRVPPAAAARS